MRARRARAFTLVELLVACALATILIGVLATTFSLVTRAYDASLDRIDTTRQVQAAFARVERDWSRAVAVAGLEGFFQVTRDPPGPQEERRDALQLLILEPEPAPPKLHWVRYRWEPGALPEDPGSLLREQVPVTGTELGEPFLSLVWPASAGAPETTNATLLGALTQLQVRVFRAGAFADEPEGASYVYRGQDASIAAFELRTPGETLERLLPGGLIALRDVRSPVRFDEGVYALRVRSEPDGGTGRLLLATPPGNAAGQVAYEAAWLPAALHLTLEVDDGRHGARRYERVVLHRSGQSELLQQAAR